MKKIIQSFAKIDFIMKLMNIFGTSPPFIYTNCCSVSATGKVIALILMQIPQRTS